MGANAIEPNREEDPANSPDVKRIASSINAFAFELYGDLAEEEDFGGDSQGFCGCE